MWVSALEGQWSCSTACLTVTHHTLFSPSETVFGDCKPVGCMDAVTWTAWYPAFGYLTCFLSGYRRACCGRKLVLCPVVWVWPAFPRISSIPGVGEREAGH